MDSRTRLLLSGLALAGLTVVWTWIGPAAEETAAPPERAAAVRAIQAPVEHVEEPLFAALDVRPAERLPGRDPWRFGAAPRPARLAATPPAVLRPSSEPAPLVPLAPAPAVTAPAPPAFPWTYLGSFGPADRRIAAFSDGATVHNRREGEILAERFVLERIGIESVDVRPLETPGVSAAPPQRLVPGAGRKGRS
jgi:hypothetical protein